MNLENNEINDSTPIFGKYNTIGQVKKASINNDIQEKWDISEYQKLNIKIIPNLREMKNSDAYAVLTDWDEFRHLDLDNSKIIFDGRNINMNINKVSIGK